MNQIKTNERITKAYIPGDIFEHLRRDDIEVKSIGKKASKWFKKLKNTNMIAPLVEANIEKTCGTEFINAGIVVFADSALGLEKCDFRINYQVTLNLKGNYDLTVYVCYHKKISNLGDFNKGLDNIYIRIPFYRDQIFPLECDIGLVNIDTIAVFLINTDPETSRGTVTTVQSGDD